MCVVLVPLQTVQKAEAGDTETIGKSDPETENEDDEEDSNFNPNAPVIQVCVLKIWLSWQFWWLFLNDHHMIYEVY